MLYDVNGHLNFYTDIGPTYALALIASLKPNVHDSEQPPTQPARLDESQDIDMMNSATNVALNSHSARVSSLV